eukprot:8590677-Pyramimonas_sp.AAC.1
MHAWRGVRVARMVLVEAVSFGGRRQDQRGCSARCNENVCLGRDGKNLCFPKVSAHACGDKTFAILGTGNLRICVDLVLKCLR